MTNQPNRVRAELPGGGVLLQAVCALCRDTDPDTNYTCLICQRAFCSTDCFEIHLNARDEFESDEAIERMLLAPAGDPLRTMVEHASESPPDWRHVRGCHDCAAEAREVLVEALFMWVRGELTVVAKQEQG